MATKVEQAPCATCNGTTTLEYFNDEFGMSPMETVTLMGAHTLGNMHVHTSMFRYASLCSCISHCVSLHHLSVASFTRTT